METPDDGFILTREGYDELQRELSEISSVKRPLIVDRIREARQLGDLSENFDYEDAKRAQAMLEARAKELKAILSHATVIDTISSDGSIGIGCKVTLKDLDDGFEDTFTIVSPAESSPTEGKISHESCVGSELMGRRAGETINVIAPGGAIRYEIMSVQ